MSNKLVENSKTQYKSLKLRIYPTKEQESLINQTFGCCRKLYNEHLQERNEFYIDNILPIKEKATKAEINQIYKTFKPKAEKEWKQIYPYMKEVSANALQQAKGQDYDCAVIKADRYFPSSQLCSKCGWQYKGLKLSEREWTCCNCGTHHIRDVNAAINLKNYVPLEGREFKSVESSDYLVNITKQILELDEAENEIGDYSLESPISLV